MLLAAVPACGMLHVKEQQAKIDATCTIGGHVEAERRQAAPIIVVLGRQVGADPQKRESWQIADHFVLEGPGAWRFSVSAGTYGVAAFQDLNQDLKLQPGEPFLSLDKDRMLTCKPGERRTDLALRIPAEGARGVAETIDIRRFRRVRTASRSISRSAR